MNVKLYKLALLSVTWIAFLGTTATAFAIDRPGSQRAVETISKAKIKTKVEATLARHCSESCELLNIDINLRENIPDTLDLGFEALDEDDGIEYEVDSAIVHVQIDKRVTIANRKRLEGIIQSQISSIGANSVVRWTQIEIPRIGRTYSIKDRMLEHLRKRLTDASYMVINDYCPNTCILSNISVEGDLITPDEALNYEAKNLVKSKDGKSYLQIDDAMIEVTSDEEISAEDRQKITNLIKAKTRFIKPVNVRQLTTKFPESFEEKERKRKAELNDPYGLNKLKQMLILFRDLAGTKEIITNNSTSKESVSNSTNSSKDSINSTSSESNTSSNWDEYWYLYVGGLILITALAFGIMARISAAKRDANFMITTANTPKSEDQEGENKTTLEGASTELDTSLGDRLRNQQLKDELIDIFLRAPKVAKATFSRILSEDGVEVAAKFLHICGNMVIFDLINDGSHRRQLLELSEYYNKSNYNFDLEEEWELLMSLRTKVRANEIRVLAGNNTARFDFLSKLDIGQIYTLIGDESPTVQSIVMTQLSKKKRGALFDLFIGQAKMDLLKELCRASAVPKDYLSNVAVALSKKVKTRPEFDVENLRSDDILLDLLEKSSLEDQKALMKNLMETNSETARAIKLKLVTIETMPYLKSGHLLEIILGLDREDILTFLAATRDHIRDLLLSNAPEELAESWMEDIDSISSSDESRYQQVELKILGRIRTLVSSGMVNLLEINELIFGNELESHGDFADQDEAYMNVPRANVVA